MSEENVYKVGDVVRVVRGAYLGSVCTVTEVRGQMLVLAGVLVIAPDGVEMCPTEEKP